ncbi:MAG: hypothetical protein QG602_4136 [Verrucomicrobiota bacterium]|nr:hypothetical protein [Verrucomicrobiota bacterium]
MNRCSPRLFAALLLLACLPLTGCVTAKYKLMPKTDTAAPPSLNLQTASPAATATLHAVVVFRGPGSWKRDAYWDEYLVTLTNPGTTALRLDTVVLADQIGASNFLGTDPWELDKLSRVRLKVAKRSGLHIAIGTGATAAWLGSGALFLANFYGGSVSAVSLGAAGFLAIPLVALGSGVRVLVARHAIREEFARRRLVLPASLPPGASLSGSLFFPVTPGPRRLLLRFKDETGIRHDLTLDLAPLADLHLKPAAKAR